jgi:hypothetical protein
MMRNISNPPLGRMTLIIITSKGKVLLAGGLHGLPSKICVMINQIRVVKHKIVEIGQIK